MKGCFKTSQAGFKALLRRQKVIDEYLNILPDQLGRFRALVSTWTKYAETQYGVSERLFFDDGFKAIPNEQAFHIIDFKKGVKYPENAWVKNSTQEIQEILERNFITMDYYQSIKDRVEAFEQDKTLNNFVGVPFYIPNAPSEMKRKVGLLLNKDEVLPWGDTDVSKSKGLLILYEDGQFNLYTSSQFGMLQAWGVGDVNVKKLDISGDEMRELVKYADPGIDTQIRWDRLQQLLSNQMYQLQSYSRNQITPEVKAQLYSFLRNVNPDFKIEVLDNLSANGLANIPEFLIQLKKGKEDLALTEETAHVFVELLNDKKLKKDLMSDVVRTRMYKQVLEEYGELYEMDYEKLKREAAAKLISLWIQDRGAFNYWSGSAELNSNLGNLINRVLDWLRKVFSPYSKAALRILKGDTQGIDTAFASYSEIFYQIDPTKFQTLGDDLTQYDKIFINLNNTILNYKDYQQEDVNLRGKDTPGRQIKGLFFSDPALAGQLDKYYQTAFLTKLGRELKEKIKLLNPKRIVFFTDAPITDALVTRLEGEFGPIQIQRTGFNKVETFEDEFGNPIDRIVSGSDKAKFILNEVESNPNLNILFVDNQKNEIFNENRPNLSLKLYSNESAKYTDAETLRKQREIKDNNKKFSTEVVEELKRINKDSLLPLVDQSMKMVKNAISKLKDEELTKIFKDEFGNIALPIDKAEMIQRLLDDTKTFEKGLLNFVQTIESTRYFFFRANENKYGALKELIEEGSPDSIDKAIREASTLMRMILSWEEWVKGVQPYLSGTKLLKGVIANLSAELKEANDQLKELSVDVLSKSLADQWKPHNDTLKMQLDQGLIDQRDYERRIYTAEKLVDWLRGKEGDMHTGSAWFENPMMSSEPVIQAISRRLELSMIGAEKKFMDESIQVSQELWDLGQKLGMSDEEIGAKLTYIDQTNQWEDGKMVQKPTLTYLNPWQNTWMLKAKKQELKDMYQKLSEVRGTDKEQSLLEEIKNKKQELDLWIQENWYDEVTPKGKNIYKEFGLEDEIFELAKERQKEIYDQMNEYTDILQQIHITEAQEEEANKALESLVRELRLLRNEFTPEGVLKTGVDLEIARKLKQKSLIDRQIYDYELNRKLFLDSINEQIVSISDESVKKILLSKINTVNLKDLKEFADQNAPQSFIDWLDRNTRTKFSDDFYEKRTELIKRLKALGGNPRIEELWKELTNLTSFLRDKDMIFDASDTSPDIQAKVREFEVQLESLKEKKASPEVIEIISQLSEIQGKKTTEYYNNVMFDWLKDVYEGISSSTNYLALINSDDFKKFLYEKSSNEFREWFERNHITRSVWNEETNEKEPRLFPTYIWNKVEPKKSEDILVVPGWKYNKRILKDSAKVEFNDTTTEVLLKTPKVDWVTWNPVERQWLPKSEAFQNKEYQRLRTSNSSQDKTLFEYLTKLTDYSKKVQLEGNRDSVLGFTVPYYHKKYTEGGVFKTAIKAITNRLNPREEGTETPKETNTWKKKLRAFVGIDTVEQEAKVTRTDYLGNKFKTVYTPYTTWLDPKDVSKNLVLDTTNYAAGVHKVKAMVNDLPQLNLLEKVFEQFLPKAKGTKNQFGQMIDAGTNNRLKVLQNIVNTKLYADNKDMELGRDIDRLLVGIRKVAAIGSQSDLNLPNAVKNWLQGQLMNTIFMKDGGWATRKSVFKAMKDPRTSYANYLYQMGNKDKSVDYYILSFFNPLLERRTQDFSRGAKNTELNDRALFFSSTASEFSVFSTLLYAHLFNQPVQIDGKDAKLYDAFTVTNGVLEIKPNTTLNGNPLTSDYIQQLKLRYKVMMESVGGKQWNETLSQRLSIWQSIEFFKRFFVPMFRRRFFVARENIELGQTEGIYITTFKYVARMLLGFIDGTKYSHVLSPEEQRNLAAARDEILLSLATLFIISVLFGFDEDDPDKYKKLKDNSWLTNMALLLAINTKRETDALLPVPFVSIQNSVYPPILNETYSFITSPFVGFQVVDEGRKMLDSLIMLGLQNDKAFYDRDMPAYLIEEGDSKFVHYFEKMIQIDNFLYLPHPAEKIQVIVGAQNR